MSGAAIVVVVICAVFGAVFVLGITRNWFESRENIVIYLNAFAVVGFVVMFGLAVPLTLTRADGITGLEDVLAYIGFLPWQAIDKSLQEENTVAAGLLLGAMLAVGFEVIEWIERK